jgi:hypothetical protein
MNVLVIDVGGSHVKLLATGQTEPRKFDSSPDLTPGRLVEGVHELTSDWEYDAVLLGYPGRSGRTDQLLSRGTSGTGGSGSTTRARSAGRSVW